MVTGDTDLVLAAAGGDRDAFASLLARHYDRLFGLCFRLTGRQDAAEDLTQDICLSLPTKMQGFRGKARFSTWLYRIAVNAAHDRRRRSVTRSRAAEGWGDWEIHRRAEQAETAALTMGDEMTHAEAAEVMGVSEGTISWRLSEIRKRLCALHERELST